MTTQKNKKVYFDLNCIYSSDSGEIYNAPIGCFSINLNELKDIETLTICQYMIDNYKKFFLVKDPKSLTLYTKKDGKSFLYVYACHIMLKKDNVSLFYTISNIRIF